jgi:hypothetical protein
VTVGPPAEFWIIDQDKAIDGSPIYNGPLNETNTYFGLDNTASFSVSAAGFQLLNWRQRWDQEVPSRFSKARSTSEHTLNEPQPLLIQSTLYGSSIHYVLNNRREWFPLSALCNAQTHYMTVNISCTPSYSAATSMLLLRTIKDVLRATENDLIDLLLNHAQLSGFLTLYIQRA